MTTDLDLYWLAQWVDEYEVRSKDDVNRLFSYPQPPARLVELAREAPTWGSAGQTVPDLSVAAGRGIDLSGTMSCGAFECVRKHIDAAYGRIFHYFDNIIVEGTSPRSFLEQVEFLPKSRHGELIYAIGEDVEILQYLKKIGADKYVLFREKPRVFCPQCMDRNAKDLGIPAYRDTDLLADAADRLAAEAQITKRWHKGVWTYWIRHEFFEEYATSSIKRAKKKPPTDEEIAYDAVMYYSGGSLADAVFAKQMHSPLARAIEPSWLDYGAAPANPSPESIALNLTLPILNGISTRDLLLLREDERLVFEKFRAALRRAIKEQIMTAESKSPREIADSVTLEYIEPALADIEQRLRVNQRKLSQKVGASIAVGGAATSAGLIASLPLVVATGVAAVATSLTQVYKYFDDRGDVQLSDMYFLWKVKNASSAHNQ